jgi:hypothetical protein
MRIRAFWRRVLAGHRHPLGNDRTHMEAGRFELGLAE